MHKANPHGQGFCTPSQFTKGLNFEYFVEQLRKRNINEPCIMHFRFATHGSIKRANCHPFNINDVYFAHNGILSVRPMRDKTDSETAFIRYLYPYIEQYGLHSPETLKMVQNIIESSKFAFMQGDDVRPVLVSPICAAPLLYGAQKSFAQWRGAPHAVRQLFKR